VQFSGLVRDYSKCVLQVLSSTSDWLIFLSGGIPRDRFLHQAFPKKFSNFIRFSSGLTSALPQFLSGQGSGVGISGVLIGHSSAITVLCLTQVSPRSRTPLGQSRIVTPSHDQGQFRHGVMSSVTHPIFASTTHNIFILKTPGVYWHIVLDGVYLIW
jgi:hypothetical protein